MKSNDLSLKKNIVESVNMKIETTIIVIFLVTVTKQSTSTNDFIIHILNDIVYLNKTQVNLNTDCNNQLKKLLNDVGSLNLDSLKGLFYF